MNYIVKLPKGTICKQCHQVIKGNWGMEPTIQKSSYTCSRCGEEYKYLCNHCAGMPCPNCGGKLKSESELALEKGFVL